MAEANEINDAEILAKSTQETRDDLSLRFKYTLPSGHKIHSEWIAADNRKKGLLLWVEAVRNAWVEDIETMKAEKRRKAAEAAPKPPPVEIVEPTQEERDAAFPWLNAQPPKPVDKPQDPSDHAKNQVRLLEAEEAHWLAEFKRATQHLATTRKLLRKWQIIVASLDAGDEDESEESGDGERSGRGHDAGAGEGGGHGPDDAGAGAVHSGTP